MLPGPLSTANDIRCSGREGVAAGVGSYKAAPEAVEGIATTDSVETNYRIYIFGAILLVDELPKWLNIIYI